MSHQKTRISCIESGDHLYPDLLKEINDPPEKMYYVGSPSKEIFENCLGVVGSRRMTDYGAGITKKIISEVASRGVTVVSGFMYGIDATAHEAALAYGGKTIAVMACGLDYVIPNYQEDLYERIIDTGGFILTEYESSHPPKSWMFPRRNRIVAGLSKAVLIVEAEENSGSLITADYAFKYKRKVLVFPQNITSANSKGITQLLKRGAKPVDSAEDILNEFDVRPFTFIDHAQPEDLKTTAGQSGIASPIESKILKALYYESLTIDELSRKTSISISELNSAMTLMILKGFVIEKGGRFYVS